MSPPIAYLVSQYPAYSHTFILREVQQLRALGMSIQVHSINNADRPFAKLTELERIEAEQTYYIKAQGGAKACAALVKTLITNPYGLLRGAVQALQLGGLDLKRSLYALFYLVEALLLGQRLRSQGIAHLHVHFATPAASVGLLVKTVFGYGFSFTLHGPDELYDVTAYNLGAKILAADFVICISHYARSQMMRLSPVSAWQKLAVCRLGVNPAQFSPTEKTQVHCCPQVLCVGRLTAAKGQALLLTAIAQLHAQGIALQLTLVGAGPDAQSLQAYSAQLGITGLVTFTGAVDQQHILAYYQKADVFVLPSFAEGLPVVLMEAMAMQLPCITTAITGIPELVVHEQNGLLVASSDVEGLALAIKRLINDAPLRARLGQAARQRVLADYDLAKNTAHLLATFTQRLE